MIYCFYKCVGDWVLANFNLKTVPANFRYNNDLMFEITRIHDCLLVCHVELGENSGLLQPRAGLDACKL